MTKTILITGATKGIGFATSKQLAAVGYSVVGIARHPIADNSFPGRLFLADLGDVEYTARAITQIAAEYKIDGIINNVGVVMPQPLGQIDLNVLDQVYDVNVRSAVQITQGFLAPMQQQRWGRIINLSSRAIMGFVGRTSYSAAKNALIGCTRTWALELAQYNITVNAVAPGPIETEMFRQNHPAGSEAEREKLLGIPLGRVGTPDEIAATIEFLLSDNAGFITGQTICVDGGGSL